MEAGKTIEEASIRVEFFTHDNVCAVCNKTNATIHRSQPALNHDWTMRHYFKSKNSLNQFLKRLDKDVRFQLDSCFCCFIKISKQEVAQMVAHLGRPQWTRRIENCKHVTIVGAWASTVASYIDDHFGIPPPQLFNHEIVKVVLNLE